MNIRNFVLCLFFCANLFQAEAQQNAPVRHISDTDRLSVQQSEVENFQYQMKRFQAAIEDGDQKSMDAMYGVLVGLMKNECEQASEKGSKYEKDLARIHQSLSAYQFKAEKADEVDFQKGIKQFGEFEEIMKDELALMEAKSGQ